MARKRKGEEPPKDDGPGDVEPTRASQRSDASQSSKPPPPAPAEGGTRSGEDEVREYTELVLLVHANNLAEAELFKTELEAHGIPAILEGEGAGVAGIPDVGAGVPVLVPEELADQAAELIAELESAKPEGNALAENEELFDEEEEGDDIEDLDNDVEELDKLDEDEELEDDDLEEEELDEEEEVEDDEEWEEDEDEEEWEDDDEDWDDEDEEEWGDDDEA